MANCCQQLCPRCTYAELQVFPVTITHVHMGGCRARHMGMQVFPVTITEPSALELAPYGDHFVDKPVSNPDPNPVR